MTMTAIKKTTNKYPPLSLVYTRQSAKTVNKRRLMKREMPEKIALPTLEGIEFQEVRTIVYLEAQGNYTSIKLLNGRKILICKTLRETEDMLRCDVFVRVHRSYTVNLHLLTKYVRGKGGYVIMEEGSVVNVSVGKKKNFLEAVEYFF